MNEVVQSVTEDELLQRITVDMTSSLPSQLIRGPAMSASPCPQRHGTDGRSHCGIGSCE
jgi:hypothetical protein